MPSGAGFSAVLAHTHISDAACLLVRGDFRVRIWEKGINHEQVVGRSKAVGAPPLMLGISVFHAINDAIASLAGGRLSPALDAPATPERVLFAVEDLKRRAAAVEPTPAQAAE